MVEAESDAASFRLGVRYWDRSCSKGSCGSLLPVPAEVEARYEDWGEGLRSGLAEVLRDPVELREEARRIGEEEKGTLSGGEGVGPRVERWVIVGETAGAKRISQFGWAAEDKADRETVAQQGFLATTYEGRRAPGLAARRKAAS